MEIKRTLEIYEKYLPSPRCRKWRSRFVQGEFTAKIREATLSDAPVVLKVHDYETYAEGLHTTDYRLYDGKLYVPALYGRYHNCEKGEYTNPVTVANDLNRLMICGGRSSRESVAAEYQREADKLLILDGTVWIKATEPFYAVQCFGLGGNHGGTALMIDRNWHHAFDEDTYSALERETAVKEAVQIALGRGDTESVAHIQNNAYRIEVLDPSVIKFHRQPRIFQAERTVTSIVNVEAYSYCHAVKIAQQLPESCFVKQNVSWHNNGEMDCDEAFYTEADVMAQPEQAQEKSGPSLSDMMKIAADIAKTLENCDFDDCTDSTGYIVIRDFGNEVSRVVDVYKYNGNGADTPHYVIYRRYEDGNADYTHTDDLTVEALAEELEEFYNEPYKDLAAASEAEADQPEQAQEDTGYLSNGETQHDCPWWGTEWGYYCPFSGHGVCFDTPCNGPVEYEEDEDETAQLGDTEAETVTAPEAQQSAGDGLEISRMLTISTAHVTEEVCDMLRERAYGDLRSSIPFVVYEKSEFGYFIYINKDELEENIANCECHPSLIDVVKYAAAHGCELLCLDRDGKMIVKDLPIYEW